MHMTAKLRIDDNKALMIGSTAETLAMARQNLKVLLPNVKSNSPAVKAAFST